ncbi:MAG: hypothetical protein JW883_10535, partial [Deltaproteobacteria bacterium]|nr:hypothetical protein [Deltaproteobacteria bacterium]
LTGGAPGLQIRCGALKPSRVGSIPMHFRHLSSLFQYIILFFPPETRPKLVSYYHLRDLFASHSTPLSQ